MEMEKMPKAPLKWVGGKAQLLPTILPLLPKHISGDYIEPFVGGGSVLLAVLALRDSGDLTIGGEVRASDANPHLIRFYQTLQNEKKRHAMHAAMVQLMTEHEAAYADGGPKGKEAHYYECRSAFNKEPTSALFLFLNKTCFRGVYREGPHGFNVPYGHYKTTPKTPTCKELDALGAILKDVHFKCSDYTAQLTNIGNGDFVFMDPPYAPETSTSFVGYMRGGFDHARLFKAVHALKVQWLMCNANVPLVLEAFPNAGRTEVTARRAIHSKKPETTTTEVFLRNYE